METRTWLRHSAKFRASDPVFHRATSSYPASADLAAPSESLRAGAKLPTWAKALYYWETGLQPATHSSAQGCSRCHSLLGSARAAAAIRSYLTLAALPPRRARCFSVEVRWQLPEEMGAVWRLTRQG